MLNITLIVLTLSVHIQFKVSIMHAWYMCTQLSFHFGGNCSLDTSYLGFIVMLLYKLKLVCPGWY